MLVTYVVSFSLPFISSDLSHNNFSGVIPIALQQKEGLVFMYVTHFPSCVIEYNIVSFVLSKIYCAIENIICD